MESLIPTKETPTVQQKGLRSPFRPAGAFWLALHRWFQENSFSPCWLPEPLRRPTGRYLAALLIEAVAVSGSFLLIRWCPEFAFKGLLPVLAVILVALSWGTGPGLLATLWGALLLDVFILPPVLAWDNGGGNDLFSLLLFLLVGIIVSLVAGQSSWARRRAEEMACSLREEQVKTEQERLRLRTLFDVLPAPVGMVDAQGQYMEKTPACKTLWGEGAPMPREIADYQGAKAWRPGTGKPLEVEEWAMARALANGEVITREELEIETFDGHHKFVLDSATPIRDETGAILGAVGILQDITERKQLEEALRRSEREAAARASQLEAVFEAMTDAVLVFDNQGRILQRNAADRQLFTFATEPRTLAERWPLVNIRDEHGQPLVQDHRPSPRVLRGELLKDSLMADQIISTTSGEDLFINVTGAPMRDAEGHIVGGVVVLRDVTERHRLERRTHEALQTLLAMAEALVQAPDHAAVSERGVGSVASLVAHRLAELTSNLLGCSSVSISTLDLERGVSQPLAVLGLSPEQERRWWAGERRSRRWMDGSHAEVLARLQAGETLVLDMTTPLLRDEPSPYDAQFFLAVPMRIGERLVGLLILNPKGEPPRYTPQQMALAEATAKLGALVIERERLLREREAAQASELALRHANQQMDTFLGIASHELKTPLTTIMLGLQWGQRRLQNLLREEAVASNGASKKLEALDEQLTRTNRQAARLDRLVNDLLDVSRIQEDKLVFRPEPADLAVIIYEVVQEQRQANPQRSIQVCLPAGQSMPVYADAGRIEQVVTNYLTNALKYSAEDESVEIGAACEGDDVRVWVQDHGQGIPLAEQEHLWERFHRVPGVEVRSGSGVGLGLGLYISKAIVERHHGQVGVESLPGAGTTFWFTLPPAFPKEEALEQGVSSQNG